MNSRHPKTENRKIAKSSGLNKSEEYLAKLCNSTFLSLWNYPNLYRAKGKELTDLFVFFDGHILIFSDKTCEYPTTNSPELNWNRWFRRTIAKSAKQLWRAEQWIRQHPERIFLDKKCLQTFPFDMDMSQANIHLILVARERKKGVRNLFSCFSFKKLPFWQFFWFLQKILDKLYRDMLVSNEGL